MLSPFFAIYFLTVSLRKTVDNRSPRAYNT
jgi:hypothetical protein